MKRIVNIVVIALMVAMLPMSAFAASGGYSDVTKKSVGKAAYKEFTYIKNHHGFSGLYSPGKKFKPYKKMTRREFLYVLANLYGDNKVPVNMSDLKNANKQATAKWAHAKMVAVADRLGQVITWTGKDKKLTRILAIRYIYVFTHFDPAFKPVR